MDKTMQKLRHIGSIEEEEEEKEEEERLQGRLQKQLNSFKL